MIIPDKPSDILGVPEKYDEWRLYQRETVDWLVHQDDRIIALDAPTGVGKSLVAIALAGLLQCKTLYIVSTLQLQNQLHDDFPEAMIIWGRDHYPCLRRVNFSSASCSHTQDSPCLHFQNCPYRVAKRAAKAARLAVVNYSYFLTECNFVGEFKGWPLVILDEGDMVEHELMHFVSLKLFHGQLKECGIDFPHKKDTLADWLAWAPIALVAVKKRFKTLEWDVAGFAPNPAPKELLDKMKRYGNLVMKLEMFPDMVDDSWIMNVGDTFYEWKPTTVYKFAEDNLFRHAKRFVAMSATMPKLWAKNLGLPPVPFQRVSSPFPKDNRPIIDMHIARYGKADLENDPDLLLTAVKAIDQLLDIYPNDKGLIHSQSYNLTNFIMENSKHTNRLLTHSSSEDRFEALQKQFDAPGPSVFVSPSMTRGVDFCGDRAGFQIVIKIPFGDMGDKQINLRKRMPGGNEWYVDETAHNLVQMCGRIIRSQDDKKPTFILDARFWNFWETAKEQGSLPVWFLEAIKKY